MGSSRLLYAIAKIAFATAMIIAYLIFSLLAPTGISQVGINASVI